MGIGKWIGGILGWIVAGPLGALAGVALGSLFDTDNMLEEPSSGWNGQRTQGGGSTYNSNPFNTGQRNSFLFSLLVMASYIIKADGKVMHSEMEYVRQFLRTNFGEVSVSQGEQILKNLFEQRKQMEARNPNAFRNTIHECGQQIAQYMTYEQRLQLLAFLANIAKADGSLPQVEIDALKEVAAAMNVDGKEVDSLLNLGGKSLDEAYKVLEIEPTATDDEVRKAYRRLALLHHPDKVATLGEDVKKAAEEKFQAINAAKEMIYKARGMK
ncbi:MAG: TerB family tellurite resistance protein [Bacteroidaceae bacterium]|nr:TerB family tellurite resistance protein [Bacteroidaceae bacterium]